MQHVEELLPRRMMRMAQHGTHGTRAATTHDAQGTSAANKPPRFWNIFGVGILTLRTTNRERVPSLQAANLGRLLELALGRLLELALGRL
jgi:hypothetical protein